MDPVQPSNEPTGENKTGTEKKTLVITPEMIAAALGRGHEVSAEKLVLAKSSEEPRLVHPFFKKSGLACLAGSSDTGKSCFLRQLAMAIVVGEKDFLGFPINATHRSVIYVSTEDDESSIGALMEYQSCDYLPEQIRHMRFIFDYEDLLQKLDASLTAQPADVYRKW